MKEKEIFERLADILDTTIPILEELKKGFFTQKVSVIQDCEKKFGDLLISRLPYAEKIIGEKEKDEAEKKYVILLPTFQTIALAIENLMYKMEAKVHSNILFSQKALSEIQELYEIVQEQLRDTKDFLLTKNPGLKESIKNHMERMFKLIEEFSVIHQNRLITGICMPQASYLYHDMTDSLKRISRGFTDLREKV